MLHITRPYSYHKMSLYTTAVCNLSCTECIMKHHMKANPRYHMTLQEIKDLIFFSERSSYCFDFVLTGGEPLLWKHMDQCLQELRTSWITKSITMFTNAMPHKNLTDSAVSCLDSIRISHYEGNGEHMDYLQQKYPQKVKIVERTEFWVNPKSPVPNSNPVECLNPEHLFYQNKVYACPHSLSIATGNKSQVKICTDLGMNYLADMQTIKKGQDDEICSMCLSNNTVRKQIIKVHNIT